MKGLVQLNYLSLIYTNVHGCITCVLFGIVVTFFKGNWGFEIDKDTWTVTQVHSETQAYRKRLAVGSILITIKNRKPSKYDWELAIEASSALLRFQTPVSN